MPQHEQAPADQVVDLAFLIGEPVWLQRNRGGNNGVMVADLAVVDITLAQGTLPCSRSQLLLIGPEMAATILGSVSAISVER